MGTQEEESAALEEVRAANEAGLLADWTLVRTPCPVCGKVRVVEVRQVMRATPLGEFSLAGNQVKFPVTLVWEYRCTACGATGRAEPKGV